MEYTLTQFRDTVGLTLETHRHWKRVLPPLARRKGRAPCFTVGDLIAGALIKHLTDTGGLRVGHLADVADTLFAQCNRAAWAKLAGSTLVLDCDRRLCDIAPSSRLRTSDSLVISFPLRPVLDRIRARLLKDGGVDRQASLRFAPVGMSTVRGSARA